jgi:hypothetical protein
MNQEYNWKYDKRIIVRYRDSINEKRDSTHELKVYKRVCCLDYVERYYASRKRIWISMNVLKIDHEINEHQKQFQWISTTNQ